MIAWKLLGAVGASVIVVTAAPARAGGHECFPTCPTGSSGPGSFTVEDTRPATGVSQPVPGRPAVNGRVADETEWEVVKEEIVPACSINTRGGVDALCNAALQCPAQDQIRYWVWHQTTHYQVGQPPDEGEWVRLSGSYCLGPDDPGLSDAPTLSDVLAGVNARFASVTQDLPSIRLQADPEPRTLVNIPTYFSAGSPDPVVLPSFPLFGRTISVTATPRQWNWYFGDSETPVVTGKPGRPLTDDVAHTYRTQRRYTVRVEVVYTGTFTVNGSGPFEIDSPAVHVSDPIIVDVREARAELVRD